MVMARRRKWLAARSSVTAEVEPVRDGIADEALRLVAKATREVDVLLGGPPEAVEAVSAAVAGLRTEGITVRVLSTESASQLRSVKRHPAEERRIEVRPFDLEGFTAVVVDRRTALVCTDERTADRAVVIQEGSAVRPLLALFDCLWPYAVQPEERPDLTGWIPAETARQVLECLRLGLTDEAAARSLVVSVRTYRRHVADIMTALGAGSRFQAGVRAARQGLLPARPEGHGRDGDRADPPSAADAR